MDVLDAEYSNRPNPDENKFCQAMNSWQIASNYVQLAMNYLETDL